MSKTVVSTPDAPKAIGPYSQAIKTGAAMAAGQPKTVWCSGQIPLDPATGELVTGDNEAQTRRVMENLKAVLAAAGTSPDQVVKTTIFLVDLADFAKVNEVYGSYFPYAKPARSTVQVAALPRGARIEVEVTAYGSS